MAPAWPGRCVLQRYMRCSALAVVLVASRAQAPNATTFSAKEGVASLLARTMSGADKRALCAAANVDV